VLLIASQPGDLVARQARQKYSEMLERDDRLLYGDDDLVNRSGRHHQPHFKPNWNAELFRHHDYLSGASLVRVRGEELARLPDDDWVEALIANLLDVGAKPKHVPAVLHHRRRRPEPELPGSVFPVPSSGLPPVSVIIPTRNKASLLRACVEGLRKTDYPEVEIIVVDNGSDEPEALELLGEVQSGGARVLPMPGAFNFSALNNAAARLATGRLLCLLNNDVEVLAADWLRIMATQAVRSDVGAVGARLLYPDRTIQHAGVVIGVGGGAGHAHRFQAVDDAGYFQRAHLPQFVSAVTAACLVVDRDRFRAVGGFDEQRFPVAFNDVDLCLRLNAKGWQSFYEPRATLIHHESKSRGKDSHPTNRDRFAREMAALKERWNTEEVQDPFHHACLSRFSERFVIDL
jgi:GT2 family glycosyltransferase